MPHVLSAIILQPKCVGMVGETGQTGQVGQRVTRATWREMLGS